MATAHGDAFHDATHEATHGDADSSSDRLLDADDPIEVSARGDITIVPIEDAASIGSELREFLERDG